MPCTEDGYAMLGIWPFIWMAVGVQQGSRLQISCVFEAGCLGSSVEGGISPEVGPPTPPPPLRSPGREVVRDVKAVAVGPQGREWMGGWDKNNPWEGGLFGWGRRGQIWSGTHVFALGHHVTFVTSIGKAAGGPGWWWCLWPSGEGWAELTASVWSMLCLSSTLRGWGCSLGVCI